MSPEKTIVVEPLGEGRWARVERAVFSALDEAATLSDRHGETADLVSTLRFRFAASLVLVGALATGFGAVTWRALAPSEARAAPTRIETASLGSRIEVGESNVAIGPQSTVRVVGDDVHGVSLFLDNGRVECDVAPRRGRPPFVIEAGRVEVRVVGTHFSVARSGVDVTVDVERGLVEVTSGHERAWVSAGEHWPAADPAGPRPMAAVASAAATEARAIDAPQPAHASDSHAQTTQATQATPPTQAAAAGLTRPSPREQYEAASRLEARMPDSAIAMYADLSKLGGPWGMNALFAEGRLQADRERRDDARRVLQEYLARFPFGPNVEDARRLLGRLR